ncbi:MAG TPA: hypothetical protein VFE36_05480 [Candidatus Baltobacteraceae bacterium]|jgi:hypothetical protein|nr:hypothetical protein [Candidatus Baltobacteraceae bacterium]
MTCKRLAFAIVFPALALATYCAAAAADLSGTWAVTPSTASGKIYFDLTIEDSNGHDRSHSGNDYTPSALGLTQQQLNGPGHHVSFTISRDAGSFACEGWVTNGRGGGSAAFSPSAEYISKMNARGYDPSSEQIASAALVDLSNAYVDGLAAAGVQKPPFEDLIAMRALNVDGSYVNDLHSVGLNVTVARDLIELKALNVNAAYVKTLATLGYTGLSSHQLVELRALKIDADFVRRVKAHGIAHPTIQDLVRLKSLNVI